MADNVLAVLFGDIADAIRGKTGGTDKIAPASFADAISGIETGGGSSADVRYVTFMSYDGTVEYGKKAVIVGDDCTDPIARGVFDTPTRESTVSTVYTFAGWAVEVNGSVSQSALTCVDEDRTVYAAYAESARIYTATFYDGDTVLATEQVGYGSEATPPDTTKEGYSFEGWTPSDLTIYGDTGFVGSWTELKGLYYVTSVSDSGLSDVSINSAGTRLAAAQNSVAMTGARVWDLSAETPTLIDTATGSNGYYNGSCGFSYNDGKLVYKGNASNAGYIQTFNGTGSCAIVLIDNSSTGTATKLATSPVEDKFAYSYASSGKYYVYTKAIGASTVVSKSSTSFGLFNCIAYNHSGALIGICHYNYSTKVGGTEVVNASSGAHVKTITSSRAQWISWSGDGSKIAVSLYASPYLEIYDGTTYEKICDLSDTMTASGYAEFIRGTNMLVVGSGTTVRVFDVSGNTPQEVEEIPAYAGGSITGIRSNLAGTRVAILSSSGVEIWGKY